MSIRQAAEQIAAATGAMARVNEIEATIAVAINEETERLRYSVHPWYPGCDGFLDGECSECARIKSPEWMGPASTIKAQRREVESVRADLAFIQSGGLAKERDALKALCERLATALQRRDAHAHAVLQRKPVRDFDEGAEEARILLAEYERLAK